MSDPRIYHEPPATREDAAREAARDEALDKVDAVGVSVGALAAAMRAVGAGRARLGELELDLTCPPAALVQLPGEFGAVDNETKMLERQRKMEAAGEKHDDTLFAAGGGRRVKLPLI